MGNDGGSIPKRLELVKTKKKEVKKDESAKLISQWFYCALSKKRLASPVVICQLGKLYNKEAILEYLINKQDSKYGDADKICSHVKSLSNIQTLNLTDNPAYVPEASTSSAPFICPLTQKEMNGNYKFVTIQACGCVVSKAGLLQVQKGALICPLCSKPYTLDQVFEILPSPERQIQLLSDLRLKRKLQAAKKSKRTLVGEDLTTSKKVKPLAIEPAIVKASTVNDLLSYKDKSKAVKSIFTSSQDPSKAQPANYLCKGTFNRYS